MIHIYMCMCVCGGGGGIKTNKRKTKNVFEGVGKSYYICILSFLHQVGKGKFIGTFACFAHMQGSARARSCTQISKFLFLLLGEQILSAGASRTPVKEVVIICSIKSKCYCMSSVPL